MGPLPPVPELIEPLFVRAGWQPRRGEEMGSTSNRIPQVLAARIVAEFGGLSVGKTGPGTELAASDVHFYTRLRPEVSEVVAPWSSRIGEAAAFATAHHDHIILLVGSGGRFYAFTDVDERLYDAGDDFWRLMHRLLFGFSVGTEVRRNEVRG